MQAGLPPFSFSSAGRIVFGRGQAASAAAEVALLGTRILMVRGRSVRFADDLAQQLRERGSTVAEVISIGEPDVAAVDRATLAGREIGAEVVLAIGGGAVIDLGKAAAALIAAETAVMDHLEIVGQGRPLSGEVLPCVAIPTTAGTGAEVTKNAVIAVPDAGRKVSLRDPRMIPRLAIVDPALTDNCPRSVTLASGLDAITQVIEPYLSCRANPLSDALCVAAIPMGLRALKQLADGESTAARDEMAYVSLSGGLALANSGLGAVHGLAGVIGGRFGAPHGLICGRLLGPVLAANHAALDDRTRIDRVGDWIAEAWGLPRASVFAGLKDHLDELGVPGLGQWIATDADFEGVAAEAEGASSMAGNPCQLSRQSLIDCVKAAL
jgi:alcohol dehydrogenase class IV